MQIFFFFFNEAYWGNFGNTWREIKNIFWVSPWNDSHRGFEILLVVTSLVSLLYVGHLILIRFILILNLYFCYDLMHNPMQEAGGSNPHISTFNNIYSVQYFRKVKIFIGLSYTWRAVRV